LNKEKEKLKKAFLSALSFSIVSVVGIVITSLLLAVLIHGILFFKIIAVFVVLLFFATIGFYYFDD